MINPQIIKVGEALFLVKKIVRFDPNMNVQDWKNWLGVDYSFKREESIYFVEEIETLHFEDIKPI